MAVLLTREEFRKAVFQRDNLTCVVPWCNNIAEDAHHIIERALWPDGGYYVENGASLCDLNGKGHHMDAENDNITPEDLRNWAGIQETVLPPCMEHDLVYDKWGLMKYPRTFHLPGSPGMTSDDKMMPSLDGFNDVEVVATVKMDDENTTMLNDHVHARSLDSPSHRSQDWVRNLWASKRYDIPEGWRVCGENLYARHSIKYDSLNSFFMMFAVFNDENTLLSWDEVVEWANLLDMVYVPVIARGGLDEVLKFAKNFDAETQEGFVLRCVDPVPLDEFHLKVGKWVRVDHVRTAQHGWRYRTDFEVNELSR